MATSEVRPPFGGGNGDVVGPASSVNNRIAVFDGVTGKIIADGGSTIADVEAASTPVTLAGTPAYITIAGQVITRHLIDLTTDVTGLLPFANLTNASAASVLLGRGSASGAGVFQEVTLGTSLSMAAQVLNTIQDIRTTASPTFNGLALTSLTVGGNAISGTNSGDVTLAGTHTYLTIAGQVITRGAISLTANVTGLLPYANIVNATAASVLVGRGSAAGGGVLQEITLGTSLSMASQVLNTIQDIQTSAAPTFAGATLSAITSITANGAASTPALKLTGTIFTGGSATTTKPQLLIEPSGTTSTGWSTAGTLIGGNGPSGFTGNLLDVQVNGVSTFKIAASGVITAADNLSFGTSINIISSGKLRFTNGGATTGTVDTALSRNAAGIFEINNGTAGTFRDLIVRNIGIGIVPIYGLHIAATSGLTAGQTVLILDNTATTGKTTMILAKGAIAGNIFEVRSNNLATLYTSITDAGVLDTVSYKVGGVAGADFGPGLPTTITVVKGIVTAIS